jgi:hypothetical protein
MKNDSKTLAVAIVDLDRVKYKKPKSMGIDYANEIDIWTRMEFKFRNRSASGSRMMSDLTTLYYAIREDLD